MRPTAIIVGGVNMLPGALRAIKSAGLTIPDDISIVGATNAELSRARDTGDTELRVDYPAMGSAASALMLGRLQGTVDGGPRVLRFETSLIKRESCASPPARAARGRPNEHELAASFEGRDDVFRPIAPASARRSIFRRAINAPSRKSRSLAADAVIFDLEDAVAPDMKAAARANLVPAFGSPRLTPQRSSHTGERARLAVDRR